MIKLHSSAAKKCEMTGLVVVQNAIEILRYQNVIIILSLVFNSFKQEQNGTY